MNDIADQGLEMTSAAAAYAENRYTLERPRSGRVPWLFALVLILELCAVWVVEWPLLYNFESYAFLTPGGFLTADYLLRHNFVVAVDFGWPYGVLPLLGQHLWFLLWGVGPAAQLALSALLIAVFAVLVACFAGDQSRAAGWVLMAVSMPFICDVLTWDVVHATEPVLLAAALVLHGRGQRSGALAFATAACFAKPSMGYVYGFLLLVLIVRSLARDGGVKPVELARAMAPAAFTGLALLSLSAAVYGPSVALKTLLPFDGAQIYTAMHWGWRGGATQFFHFPGVRLGYYLGTPVTVWCLGSLYILGTLAATLWTCLVHKSKLPRNWEIALSCAVLHFAFVGLFFGPYNAWRYYVYILFFAILTTETWNALSARMVWILSVVAAVANFSAVKSGLRAWQTMVHDSATAGLFAPPQEAAEWHKIQGLVGANAVLFTWDGGGEALFPWLRRPVKVFMDMGVGVAAESSRELAQMSSARFIIAPTLQQPGDQLSQWRNPAFQQSVRDAPIVFRGVYFDVYARGQPQPEMAVDGRGFDRPSPTGAVHGD